MNDSSKGIVNLLFEVGILAKTPRSGFYFLGSGQQSVAEHVHRVVYVGWVLATLENADQIEWLLSLKEQVDIGNSRAASWIPSAIKRLKTEKAQAMAEQILQTDSDSWWFSDKESDWWVNRDQKTTKKRF